MKHFKKLMFPIALLFAGCGGGNEEDAMESIVFYDIDCPSKRSSGFSLEPGFHSRVFYDVEDFQSFYTELTGEAREEITAEAFEGHTIVAVSMGGSLSPSDELDVIGVYDSEDSIVVETRHEEPGGGCGVDGFGSTPYCIVAIPVDSKPVSFQHATVKKCN